MKVQVTIDLKSVDRLHQKAKGRIFVRHKEHVQQVAEILKQIDEFEYNYLPDNFIAVYNEGGPNHLIYTHKFDPNILTLEKACLDKGIKIVVYSSNLCKDYYGDIELNSHIDLNSHLSSIINGEYHDEH